jgi:trehalose 6-phosphate synthase/phosphatase
MKKKLIPILSRYVQKLPGSFIEEKEYSLAFHYRTSDAVLASLRIKELMDHLVSFTSNIDLQLINGARTLEVRNAGVDKGVAAMHWLSQPKEKPVFILAAGDDQTDEDMFRVMPAGTYSIKIGSELSYAGFNLHYPSELLSLLNDLVAED